MTHRLSMAALLLIAACAAGCVTIGAHMRCRFRLVHPDGGMAGGGRGECQMPDGARIDAQFPNA